MNGGSPNGFEGRLCPVGVVAMVHLLSGNLVQFGNGKMKSIHTHLLGVKQQRRLPNFHRNVVFQGILPEPLVRGGGGGGSDQDRGQFVVVAGMKIKGAVVLPLFHPQT